MGRPAGTGTLADALNELKHSSGLSYQQIGDRAHFGRSTVHRYCSGQSVPASFGTVELIAKVCGADRDSLSGLYRLWEQANDPNREAEPEEPPAAAEEVDPPVEQAPVPPKRRGWWLVVAAAAITAVVGAYAYLPEDRTEVPRRDIAAPNWTYNPGLVPPEFVGVTINSATGAMPSFPVGSVRLWDSKTRWQVLEPERGRFDWTVLDRHLAGAGAKQLPVDYVLGGTPGWAAPDGPPTPYGDGSRTDPPDDLADWEQFLRALVTHADGRIESYELWDIGTPPFFTGSVEELVGMARVASGVIRELAPAANVVCPGFTGLWEPANQQVMQRFAELGGYDHCDYAAVKLYPRDASDPPETMMQLAREVERTLARARTGPQLWATGWGTEVTQQSRVDPELAADYAVRSYLVSLWRWYDRSYFYSWGGSRVPIVLQTNGYPPTKAGLFVGELHRWLADAKINSCGHGAEAGLPDNVWQCHFLRRGQPFFIRWTHESTARMRPDPGTTTVRRLDGTSAPVDPAEPVEITGRPVLLERG
ncbi:helix-turn-helix transcriptional regulator [Saccharopolyspora sp. NPDC000359]|uniref:helix-turn-helix domain-containing protein n=1 Tax=Saccharopolyspora sp. NPDC000359 TaxID=3154251 RepID=UPI00331C24BA